MTQSFLIFGAGYSGRAFGAMHAGSSFPIHGTTRSAQKSDALLRCGIEPLIFDGTTLSADLRDQLEQATHLIVSAAPSDAGDPVLTAIGNDMRRLAPRLRWIGYLSTVGVYGNHDGGWVDETSECRPLSRRSIERLEVERQWQELGRNNGVPVAILRLSGIYGPGRNAFVNLANGTAKRLIKPGQVFNRIHVTDIAGTLHHLAGQDIGGIFNVTDDLPAPAQDVVSYAASLMGVEPPPEIPFADAELSPMARSFYGENKRVSNSAIRETGYLFHYPDYHAAFDAMWAQGNWAGEGEGDGRTPIRRS